MYLKSPRHFVALSPLGKGRFIVTKHIERSFKMCEYVCPDSGANLDAEEACDCKEQANECGCYNEAISGEGFVIRIINGKAFVKI